MDRMSVFYAGTMTLLFLCIINHFYLFKNHVKFVYCKTNTILSTICICVFYLFKFFISEKAIGRVVGSNCGVSCLICGFKRFDHNKKK